MAEVVSKQNSSGDVGVRTVRPPSPSPWDQPMGVALPYLPLRLCVGTVCVSVRART